MFDFYQLNEIFRSKTNSLSIEYKKNQIPVYYETQHRNDSGPFVLALMSRDPTFRTEIGENSAQQITGFWQYRVFVPASDNGIDSEMNKILNQISLGFPIRSEVIGNFKVEITEYDAPQYERGDGHYVQLIRVGFRAFYCN